MPRKIALIILGVWVCLVAAAGTENYAQQVSITVAGAPYVQPIGVYHFKLNEPATERAGALRGYGMDVSFTHNPVKYFVYGLRAGFYANQSDIRGLSFPLQTFLNNLKPAVQNCNCDGDTVYYLNSTPWYVMPLLGEAGFYLKRRIEFSLTSGVGVMVAFTPKIGIEQWHDVWSNVSAFDRVVGNLPSQTYALFAYGFSTDLGYRFHKVIGAGIAASFTGTQKRYMPFVKSPEYGYKGAVQFFALSAYLRFYIPLMKEGK